MGQILGWPESSLQLLSNNVTSYILAQLKKKKKMEKGVCNKKNGHRWLRLTENATLIVRQKKKKKNKNKKERLCCTRCVGVCETSLRAVIPPLMRPVTFPCSVGQPGAVRHSLSTLTPLVYTRAPMLSPVLGRAAPSAWGNPTHPYTRLQSKRPHAPQARLQSAA